MADVAAAMELDATGGPEEETGAADDDGRGSEEAEDAVPEELASALDDGTAAWLVPTSDDDDDEGACAEDGCAMEDGAGRLEEVACDDDGADEDDEDEVGGRLEACGELEVNEEDGRLLLPEAPPGAATQAPSALHVQPPAQSASDAHRGTHTPPEQNSAETQSAELSHWKDSAPVGHPSEACNANNQGTTPHGEWARPETGSEAKGRILSFHGGPCPAGLPRGVDEVPARGAPGPPHLPRRSGALPARGGSSRTRAVLSSGAPRR